MIELFLFLGRKKGPGPSKYQTLSDQKVVGTTCSNINIYLFLFEASSCPIIPIIPGPCKALTRNLNVSTLNIPQLISNNGFQLDISQGRRMMILFYLTTYFIPVFNVISVVHLIKM